MHAFNAKSALFRSFLQADQEIGDPGGKLCAALGARMGNKSPCPTQPCQQQYIRGTGVALANNSLPAKL
ncbi:MAG: hypothetical protein EA401_07460 [Planctomycetota bacterium]|nr:MAG: hypothetical protein EA401_07460 [Planctomycetota bacterium]